MTYILHISDLHFKKNAAAYNTEEIIIQEAAKKVKSIPKGNKLLIVTGDFHDFWDTDYARAETFLNRLTQAMEIDVSQDVFVIPGNHDVGNPTAMIACGSTETCDIIQEKAVEQLKQWTGNKDHERFMRLRMEAFRPYCQFVQSLGIYDTTNGFNYPATSHVRSWRGKLNILHLNTALVANGKAKNDQMTDTDAAADPVTWEGYFQEDVPTLAIGHNSFFDLHKDRMAELATLFTFRNVSAYLCGDTHQTEKDPYKQMIRLEAGHKKGEEIPNLVAAKVIADGNDTYSEIGYCWHEWDEETGNVNVEFRKWEKSCLAQTTSGSSGSYQMRSVKSDKETLNLVDESEEKENGKRAREETSEPDFLPATYVEAVRRLNARLRKVQSKVRVYYWDELDFSSIYIIPLLRKRPEELPKASLNNVDNLQSITDNNEKGSAPHELSSIVQKKLAEQWGHYGKNSHFGGFANLVDFDDDTVGGGIGKTQYLYPKNDYDYGYFDNRFEKKYVVQLVKTLVEPSRDILVIRSQKNEEDNPVTIEEKVSIINRLFSYSRIVYIVGGAGFGKSLFLKKLCVDPHLIDGYSQKPFLVLRGDIKNMIRADGSIKPMLDFLEERLTAGSFEKSESIGPHFLEDCLKAGRCLILLDALDEVGNDIRTELHELIVSFFQETYPGNRICITSRERGFIPKKDIDCYYISRIKKTDIEQYIDRFIALDKFAPDEKQPFLEKASVLVSKGFIQGFLTLSLLLAIYKNELSLPTNKLLLYEKCFEYIANSREQGKKLLKNSKTGEEYDWNALGTLLQDATFMEFASLGYPNNRDVSVHDIEETIFSLYGGRFESKTRSNIVSEMFLQFCSDRTEVFVPSQYSNDAYRFFHRSFFDYFYAKYIEWKTKTVDETLELIYKLDIDSEAIELLMTIYSQRSPRYLRELVEKALRNLNESLDNKKGSSTYLDSLILMMQDVEEIVYCQKFIRLLFDREEKIRMVRIKTSFDLVHALFNKHYVEYLKQYADHIESMSNNAKRQILNTMFKEHGSLTDWIVGKTSELPLPTSVDASTGINAAKITFGAPDGLSCINNWIDTFSSRAFLIGKEKLKSHNADIISEIAKSIKQLPQEKREYLTEWIVANT